MSYPIKAIKPQQMAQALHISVSRLQYIDRIGIFKSRRTDTNRRYYLLADLLAYQNDVDDESKVIHFISKLK